MRQLAAVAREFGQYCQGFSRAGTLAGKISLIRGFTCNTINLRRMFDWWGSRPLYHKEILPRSPITSVTAPRYGRAVVLSCLCSYRYGRALALPVTAGDEHEAFAGLVGGQYRTERGL